MLVEEIVRKLSTLVFLAPFPEFFQLFTSTFNSRADLDAKKYAEIII